MKHSEVITLNKKLLQVRNLVGFEINFCIKQNLIELKKHIQPLLEMEQEIETGIKPFLTELKSLREAYATVNGKIQFKKHSKNKEYDIPEDKLPALEKDVADLKIKHAELLEVFYKKTDDFQKFLDETDSIFVPVQVDKHCIQNDIDTVQFNLIFDLIKL